MGNIKKYNEFIGGFNNKINESFTITIDQLPSIGDIVDNIHWKEGEKFAFIDFKGIKNIPVNIIDNIDKQVDNEQILEPVVNTVSVS